MVSKPKVKVCCIASIEEARLAIASGATAIGLVGPMPSGPGIIKEELIKSIAEKIPSSISSFLLTSETSVSNIVAHHKRVNTNTIQLVDRLKEGSYQDLRARLNNVDIVQVIHVLDERSVDQAIQVSALVDYILLDSGNPNLAVKEFGGTGRVHNWDISKMIVEQVDIPVYLAGGLNSKNVKAAIEYVKPYGVDLCTGVRTNKMLDLQKLEVFFNAVKSVKALDQ